MIFIDKAKSVIPASIIRHYESLEIIHVAFRVRKGINTSNVGLIQFSLNAERANLVCIDEGGAE